jgi:hypothetical protein
VAFILISFTIFPYKYVFNLDKIHSITYLFHISSFFFVFHVVLRFNTST